MHDDEPIVMQSAYRHGASLADIRHAVSHYSDTFDMGDGMTMVIGVGRSGAVLEVGIVERYDDLYVVHAMSARAKFLR